MGELLILNLTSRIFGQFFQGLIMNISGFFAEAFRRFRRSSSLASLGKLFMRALSGITNILA